MANPSNEEQLLLELINNTRLDPQGNASRYIGSYFLNLTSTDPQIQSALTQFNVSGLALQMAFNALRPTHPVAWNSDLNVAATGHGQLLVANDSQSHQEPGEPDLGQRVLSTGYDYWIAGENVYSYAYSMLYAHAGFMVDWGSGPGGMQNPAGHRINVMDPDFREVGISAIAESDPNTEVGPWVVTQEFGTRLDTPQVFILGVSYQDSDGSAFYTPGEGRSGMSINASGQGVGYTTSSGGFALGLDAGSKTITFNGGGLVAPLAVSGTFTNGTNAKLDVVDTSTVQTSVDLTIVSGVTKLVALSAQGLQLTGTAGVEELVGSSGNDVLVALGGSDTARGAGGNDYLYMGEGNDTAYGGSGVDVILLDAGDDVAHGDGDQDYLFGGVGNDTLWGEDGVDVLQGEDGDDIFLGGGGGDYVYGGTGNDTASGGDGNDIFVMGEGSDFAAGDAGQDYFYLGNGDDSAEGGEGVDVFLGEAGDDTFDGGTGVDYAWGGAGNDAYLVSAESGVLVIQDFAAGGTDDAIVFGSNLYIWNLGQVLSRATYYAGMNTTILTLDADTAVWLVGIDKSQLTVDDFLRG